MGLRLQLQLYQIRNNRVIIRDLLQVIVFSRKNIHKIYTELLKKQEKRDNIIQTNRLSVFSIAAV